ncbi:MAG: hypothetical protein A4E38_01245 [Methanoregulaceae archaeon PtaB.Bin108]|nr:MAG: hypothetical protein A4E38_01245 [Methanoregulaceae archaeon PtaB.Bin108]
MARIGNPDHTCIHQWCSLTRLISPGKENMLIVSGMSGRNRMTDDVTPEKTGTPHQSGAGIDPLQQFFQRPLFLSLTIGIPFCIFKLLFGIAAIRVLNLPHHGVVAALGWCVIVWAGIDLLMNAGRAILDLLGRSAPFEYCTIAQLGAYFRMPLVFLAVDTLLSFVIICTMLWSGWITLLTTIESYLWYAATTLNLISLSLVLLYNEVRKVRI